mmetsp:Transcript_57722/g.95431  ORF Transcript_57722/g.95431 Transcript_57722/m.95431 type:complete len:99 (+) Transcript_57722:270-566(+)
MPFGIKTSSHELQSHMKFEELGWRLRLTQLTLHRDCTQSLFLLLMRSPRIRRHEISTELVEWVFSVVGQPHLCHFLLVPRLYSLILQAFVLYNAELAT